MQSEESAVDKLVSTCTDWYDCSIKAIGGSGAKNQCRAHLKDLH